MSDSVQSRQSFLRVSNLEKTKVMVRVSVQLSVMYRKKAIIISVQSPAMARVFLINHKTDSSNILVDFLFVLLIL